MLRNKVVRSEGRGRLWRGFPLKKMLFEGSENIMESVVIKQEVQDQDIEQLIPVQTVKVSLVNHLISEGDYYYQFCISTYHIL